MIVGADEVERGVEQPGLLQADEDRVGADIGAEAADGKLDVGLPRVFFRVGDADDRAKASAALEDAAECSLAELISHRGSGQSVESSPAVAGLPGGRQRVLDSLGRADPSWV